MKKIISLGLFVLISTSLIFIISCNKKTEKLNPYEKIKAASREQPVDYYIFGKYVGEFREPYTISFKFDKKNIYVDTLDKYQRNEKIVFENYKLPSFNNKYAEKVFEKIPKEIINNEAGQNDCTTCYDAGGIYLEIFKDNKKIIFHTNCKTEKCSDSLTLFLNKISNLTDTLININKINWH